MSSRKSRRPLTSQIIQEWEGWAALTHFEGRVLITAAAFGNPDGANIFPSSYTIAKLLGTDASRVRAALRFFREAGILVLVSEATGTRPPEYRFTRVPRAQIGKARKEPVAGRSAPPVAGRSAPPRRALTALPSRALTAPNHRVTNLETSRNGVGPNGPPHPDTIASALREPEDEIPF
jgi:hypothetical protein